MSRHLARLKRLLAEKRLPEEPTKLTKASFVGSVSDQDSRFSTDEAAIEERAGIADRVPAVYLDEWARLNHQTPVDVSEADWRRALDDGGRFLDVWGSDAAALGWTPGALFEVASGLVWRLGGERVEGLGVDSARLSAGQIFTLGDARDTA